MMLWTIKKDRVGETVGISHAVNHYGDQFAICGQAIDKHSAQGIKPVPTACKKCVRKIDRLLNDLVEETDKL